MKTFYQMNNNKPVLIVELSIKDMVKLMFGRELVFVNIGEKVLFRYGLGYSAFNLSAKAID
jgi:hypothetical protein